MLECSKYVDTPIVHPHYLSAYILSKSAQKYGKVLIGGEGADDLFMGYDHYLAKDFINKSFAFRRFLNDKVFNSLLSDHDIFQFVERINQVKSKIIDHQVIRDFEIKTILNLLMRNDQMFG